MEETHFKICVLGINIFLTEQMPRDQDANNQRCFFKKGVLKICSKFTREHLCRSVISMKLLCNFIEITLWWGCSLVNLLHIFRKPLCTRHLVKHWPADLEQRSRWSQAEHWGSNRSHPEHRESYRVTSKEYGSLWSNTEQGETSRSTKEHHEAVVYLMICFLFQSGLSISRYIWKQISVGKPAKYIELSFIIYIELSS